MNSPKPLPTQPALLRQLVATILDDALYLRMTDLEREATGLPVSVEDMRRFILLHRKDYVDASK